MHSDVFDLVAVLLEDLSNKGLITQLKSPDKISWWVSKCGIDDRNLFMN